MDFDLYQPHANQVTIHESPAKYRVVVAGRRFGKSALALNEALARGFQLKNQIIWIILPLFRQAKEIYWIDPDITKYFMPYVQAGLIKVDKSELSLHILSTNSYIRLKGSDNYDSLRGSGLDLIIWDEAADVKKEAFDTIKPALADSPRHRVLYIGTPKGLNWFHDFALKGDHGGIIPTYEKKIKIDDEWQTWHFTSYDNMTWAEGSYEREMFVKYIDKERTEAEERGTLDFFNQEYMASFEEGAGMYFPTWSRRTHVCNPFMPDTRTGLIVGGMDWGFSAPFSLHLSEVRRVLMGPVLFYRVKTFLEVYGNQKTPREWAPEIRKKLKEYNITFADVAWVQADPATFNKGTDGSIAIRDQFVQQDNGFRKFRKGSNDRIAGWVQMRNWMTLAPDGLPYWQISNECPRLIDEIVNATFDENNPEDLFGEFDHALDDQRYQLKGLKWMDAKELGAMYHEFKTPRLQRTAHFIGTKQASMDIDDWAGETESSGEMGGVRR